MNTEPVVVEQEFGATVSELWNAITDKDQMRQWFFEAMTEFEPKVGFETQFDIEFEGQTFNHQWKITDVVPESKIVYDWSYGGFPGESSVAWELSGTEGGSKLTLTHSGHETFPQDNPAFSRENGEAGWNFLICNSLKAFLDS